MLTSFLFIVGFALLVKGADLLVMGSSSLAKRLGIPSLVIGLTIVAFGTSMPELLVNIIASVRGNTDIAIGNVIGSNIANLFLILGISCCIYPLTVQRNTTWKEIPLSLLAALVLLLLANDGLIEGAPLSVLSRIDGFILIAFLIIFIYYTIGIALAGKEKDGHYEERPILYSIAMIGGGMLVLFLGGKWVVEGAVLIARLVGLSEVFIGLTIVSIGTSLPELVTSVVAAHRRQSDIAIGNVVGSNIFNIFWILGVSSLISPLPFDPRLNTDVIALIVGTLLLFIFMFIGKRHEMERSQGVVFILSYLAYIAYLILRG